jgi:hypothetical protein
MYLESYGWVSAAEPLGFGSLRGSERIKGLFSGAGLGCTCWRRPEAEVHHDTDHLRVLFGWRCSLFELISRIRRDHRMGVTDLPHRCLGDGCLSISFTASILNA